MIKFKDYLNENKYFVEVGVGKASIANDALNDELRGSFKTKGSNYFEFKTEDDYYNALETLRRWGLEYDDLLKYSGDDDETEDAMNESPVGQRGRTGINDAKNHISDDLIKDFNNIVKKLGGKTVARQILGGYKPEKKADLPKDLDSDGGVPEITLSKGN